MKKLFLFATLFVAGTTIAQIKITQLHINSGNSLTFNNSFTDIADFALLAPGSTILNQDFSQYSSFGSLYNNHMMGMNRTNSSISHSIQLGLNFEKCPKGTLRIGLTNTQNYLLNAQGSYWESHIVDTFTSSQTGEMIFADSTISKSYFADYSNSQLRLDAAYIYEASAGKRWAFHTGIGMSMGVSYRSSTNLYFEESTDPNNMSNTGTNIASYSSTKESFDNNVSIGASAYIPLGIDFKLGNKRAFWKPFVVYAEFRPTMNFNTLPNQTTQFGVGMGSVSGLRYNIVNKK